MSHYQSVSSQIFAVFAEFTPLVEGLSLDEAFLDVTGSVAAFGPAEAIAAAIKRRIREATLLTCSVGVAPSKLVAKIASDLEKPDGLVVVPPDRVNAVLDPLPVRRLSGLGSKTAPRVEALGIRTLGELRSANTATLRPVFGRYAERVQQRAAGIDDRPVVPDLEELQISAEETFDTDIADHAQLQSELTRLTDRSAARLRARRLVAACVTIKIRRKDFTTYTRQRHIEPPTQETRVIAKVAAALLDAWLATQPTAALRLLGVGVSQLSPALQMELFATPESERNQQLDRAVDDIRDRFGRSKLTRASSVDPK
jgi:DNA polymerase IV